MGRVCIRSLNGARVKTDDDRSALRVGESDNRLAELGRGDADALPVEPLVLGECRQGVTHRTRW